jgi:MATE family multidrug resistance protein
MLQELKSAAPGAITGEARQIVRLALPMMIAQVAQVATGFVDTVMAGRVSTTIWQPSRWVPAFSSPSM